MLYVKDVAVTYDNGVAALNATTASFARGKFFVLLGPSGAGKSTLLKCLNGLVRPTSGTVNSETSGSIFASRATLRAHRRRTGMVFQQHHLIGRLSALENVLTGRLAHHSTMRTLFPLPRKDRLMALECLDRVRLSGRALSRADQLSGGEQQRVGIARAMAQKPAIILADEPVASLDPETALMVLKDLHRICREDSITAIVSLHQVDLARQFADHVIGLSQGRVVFEGGPDMLVSSALDQIYKAGRSRMLQAAE